MMADFWGPEILVNGERPEWLSGRVVCDVRTKAGWCYTDDRVASDEPAQDWTWKHADGSVCIIAIRLPTRADLAKAGAA